jgi:hypothetical protein
VKFSVWPPESPIGAVRLFKKDADLVDATGMTAPPEGLESTGMDDAVRPCADCGRPIEAGAGESYRLCRACYDAYVDNAGR